MKKVLIVLFVWSTVHIAYAQPENPTPKNQINVLPKKSNTQDQAHKMTAEMAKSLNLSDEQKLKVMLVNVDKNQKAEIINVKKEEANKTFKVQLDKLENEREIEFRKIMTKEQFQRFLREKENKQKTKTTKEESQKLGKPQHR